MKQLYSYKTSVFLFSEFAVVQVQSYPSIDIYTSRIKRPGSQF